MIFLFDILETRKRRILTGSAFSGVQAVVPGTSGGHLRSLQPHSVCWPTCLPVGDAEILMG